MREVKLLKATAKPQLVAAEPWLFPIKRAFVIHNAYGVRGRHAHKKERQIIYCVQGPVKIVLRTPIEHGEFRLKVGGGLYVPSGIWIDVYCELSTILLVVSDMLYDEDDYIRSWSEFCDSFV